jgi:hypothetical protein
MLAIQSTILRDNYKDAYDKKFVKEVLEQEDYWREAEGRKGERS